MRNLSFRAAIYGLTRSIDERSVLTWLNSGAKAMQFGVKAECRGRLTVSPGASYPCAAERNG
jgi:hypothetical protein